MIGAAVDLFAGYNLPRMTDVIEQKSRKSFSPRLTLVIQILHHLFIFASLVPMMFWMAIVKRQIDSDDSIYGVIKPFSTTW